MNREVSVKLINHLKAALKAARDLATHVPEGGEIDWEQGAHDVISLSDEIEHEIAQAKTVLDSL